MKSQLRRLASLAQSHPLHLTSDVHLRPPTDGSLPRLGRVSSLVLTMGLSLVFSGVEASAADGSNEPSQQVAVWGRSRYGMAEIPNNLSSTIQVAAGFDHLLALHPDGSVTAWGSNLDGEREVPSNLGPVVAVYAGDWVSYALKADGTVVGWGGLDGANLVPVPAGVTDIVSLDVGYAVHVVALRRDGTVVAWGGNNFAGQGDVPEGLANVVQVSAGYGYSLALKADGTVVAWGSEVPMPQPTATHVVAVAAGWNDAFLLQADGQVIHWGPTGQTHGAPFPGISNAISIAANRGSVIALHRDGTLTQWPPAVTGASSVPMPQHLQGVTRISAHGDSAVAMIGLHPLEPYPLRIVPSTTSGPTLQLPTVRGRTYRLEGTPDFSSDTWHVIAIRPGIDADITYPAHQEPSAMFYRLFPY